MTDKSFTVDARTVLSLGRDSIKDHITAVIELVKNGFDAGASIVEVSILIASSDGSGPRIMITDDGHGMTESMLISNWLRIGYSAKRKQRVVDGRRMLGEKGVGRLSADRLGSILELRTQHKSAAACGIQVSWDRYERDIDISSVSIPDIDDPIFTVPIPTPYNRKAGEYGEAPSAVQNSRSHTGTSLVISGLRQGWSHDDVDELRRELQQLVNPFLKKGLGFQVRITTDISTSLNGVVTEESPYAGEISGEFRIAKNRLTCLIKTRMDQEPTKTTHILEEIIHKISDTESLIPLADIGPIDIHLRIYTTGQDIESSIRKGDVKQYLKHFAGIRIYRDQVRVLPYGDPMKPEGDWLQLGQRKALNPAGIDRKDWRVESNRVVGALSIGRDENPELADSASREGLIDNDAFRQLRTLTMACLRELELAYWKFRQRDDREENAKPKLSVGNPTAVEQVFSNLQKHITDIEKGLETSEGVAAAQLRDKVENYSSAVKQLKESVTHVLEETVSYRGLATLGIAHASFGHEIQLSAAHLINTAMAAADELDEPPDLPAAREEIAKTVAHGKKISGWGRYTLQRIGIQKRTPKVVQLDAATNELLTEMRPYFVNANTDLAVGVVQPISSKIIAMDFESILVNLLTNAYDFVRLVKTRSRKVRVDLHKKTIKGTLGFELTVADSGPGVADIIKDNVWKALFTTKEDEDGTPRGTGLGLAIIKSIVDEHNGSRSIDRDSDLGGAAFHIWLPIT